VQGKRKEKTFRKVLGRVTRVEMIPGEKRDKWGSGCENPPKGGTYHLKRGQPTSRHTITMEADLIRLGGELQK